MSEKSPAFQWYPKDYLTDENVARMSLEQEGAYRRLLDYCWLHVTLPSDIESLAGMCRVQPDTMEALWPAIRPCFAPDGDRLRSPRLDRERRKQEARKKAKSEAGKKGADARWSKEENGTAMPVPMADDASPSSSASPTPVGKERAKDRKQRIPEGWSPNPSHAAKAKAERVDLDREAERFRHHHAAKGTRFVDWDRAFHTWLMRSADFRPSNGTAPSDAKQGAGFYR